MGAEQKNIHMKMKYSIDGSDITNHQTKPSYSKWDLFDSEKHQFSRSEKVLLGFCSFLGAIILYGIWKLIMILANNLPVR